MEVILVVGVIVSLTLNCITLGLLIYHLNDENSHCSGRNAWGRTREEQEEYETAYFIEPYLSE